MSVSGPLTHEQIDTYRRTGFLLVKDLLSADEKAALLTHTADIQDWPESSGQYMKYYELGVDGIRKLCRVENFVPFHDGLRKILDDKVTAAVSQLFDEPAVLYKDKINFKLPNGSGFKAHQDAPAFSTFKQKNHLSVMLAVDAANPQNGCLEAVSGDWEGKLFPHPGGEMEPSLVAEWEEQGLWKPIIVDSGDIVFFSSFLPHRSGPNLSSGSRRTFYLT
eukprot:TRINITY_DN2598_c0_g1_i3.p1 TRINITY_DN2598_c0_g1~~TRINITY_DN2598_c0_g1_i3.p1  ORF type:complete len:220 (-),score=51.51 TRINITY_DN2598_c0_g1_i3:393-1052(-)